MIDAEEQAEASLAEARLLAAEQGSRSRARSSAPARSARRSSTRPPTHEVDLIVLGSAPRWRRQSRFFSPTVDYVLRKAPCEVMVIAYPQGVLERKPWPELMLTSEMKAIVIGCGRVGSPLRRSSPGAAGT